WLRIGAVGPDGRASYANLASTRTSHENSAVVVVGAGAVSVSTGPPYFGAATEVRLELPAGALPPGTSLRLNTNVEHILQPPVSNTARLIPLGASVGIEITAGGAQPAVPGTLTVTYNPAAIPAGRDPRQLKLCFYDEGARLWTVLPSQVDTAARTVAGTVPHFSLFAPFFVEPGDTIDGVEVFPVPWEPGSGTVFDALGVTFSGLPLGADVRVFSLRGERVWEDASDASGIVFWRGRNRHGQPVGSGVYVVSIVAKDGRRVLRRLAVVR
ncbi:MAG: hypothetical protein HY554_19310, partial [Elusimicrobia bacterium]|nr:hypothetical protein [Elusimicrobiota bacterium]